LTVYRDTVDYNLSKNQGDTCQNNLLMGRQSDGSTNRVVLVHPGKFRAITRSGDIFCTNMTFDSL